jgi:TPR repeat protein
MWRNLVWTALLALTALSAGPARAGLADGEIFFDQGQWRKAMAELRPLAEAGGARAQFLVATMLDEGGHGIVPDKPAALAWYHRAADQGHVGAQYALYLHYAVTPDPENQRQEKAISWARRIVEAGPRLEGHERAQAALSAESLAVYYERGLFTPADPARAYLWYLIAERLGWENAAVQRKALADSLDAAVRAAVAAEAEQWWMAHGGH